LALEYERSAYVAVAILHENVFADTYSSRAPRRFSQSSRIVPVRGRMPTIW